MAKKKNAAQEAASLWQRLSQGAGNIVGGLTRQPMVSPLPQRQPIKLQDNFVSQLGRSSVGRAITGFQSGIEQRTFPKVNLTQYTQNIQAPVPRFAAQMGASFGEDIINLPQRLLEGGGRIGTQVIRPMQQGMRVNPAQAVGAFASAGAPLLDIATLGGGSILKGIGKQAVGQLGEQTLKQAVGRGAIQGGIYGAGFGGLRGLAAGDEANLAQFVKGLAGGAVLGGALGGAAGGIGGLIGLMRKSPTVEKQLRDAMGRYTAGQTPIKPKGMTKPQWDFQLKFNQKYNRNPYTPVYPDDLKTAVAIEVEKKGAGLSIRDLSKETTFDQATGKVNPNQAIQKVGSESTGTNPLPNQQNPTLQSDLPNNPSSMRVSQLPSMRQGGLDTNPLPPRGMGQMGRVQSQLVETSTTGTQLPQQLPQDKLRMGNGQLGDQTSAFSNGTQLGARTLPEQGKSLPPNPNNLSSGGSIPQSDPVQKIIQALKEAKPIRKEQEALYSADRARRVAKAAAVGQKIGGEQGYYAQLGSLKGELRKAQFEGVREKLTSDDINKVFQMVEDVPYFSTFEKVTAKTGLAKLLGKEGGVVPNNSELKLLNEIFPPEFIKAAQGNKTMLQKIMGGLGDIAALPRSLMVGGLDMSYGLRQGVFSGYRHPKQWASAFKDQFKYFGSEKALQNASNQIQAHPNYKLAREAGLAMTDLKHGHLSPGEEQFQSALAEKIPGIGKLVRASGRAYTGFANKYRFDMFNDLVAQAKKTGDFDDPKFLQSAGELVNTLTGRGSLGPLEKSAGVLSTTLFSPRLLASRLQLMNPQFYMKMQPLARRRALESLVAYAAGTSTILGAAKLAGADVGTDPTSSDFAKVKVGNTRMDIMGGFQQPIVLLSRIITGKSTSSTTGKTMVLGEGYNAMNQFDIVQRFFESKEAPVVSFFTSLAKGEDAIGNKFNLSTELINRVVPMFISDMVELYKDGGLSSLPLGIPAFFGTGNQTYGKTELVTGKNQLGESTSQIRPLQGLGETITEKVFGQQPLGSSRTSNVQSYYDQMLKMPQGEAAAEFDKISKTNPDLAKKILQVHKDKQKGVTVDDQVIKAKGVASGDRAISVADEFNKLKSNEEKAALWEHYVKVGVITKDVAKQLGPLLTK